MNAWKPFILIAGVVAVVAAVIQFSGSVPAAEKAAPKVETVELNVSAAMGLKEALADIQKVYEAKHPNIKLVYNLAASGALQTQIEQGAPADIFISAANKQIDDLIQKGMVIPASRKALVSNELVVIVPKDNKMGIASFQDIEKVTRFGLGAPETVPAGQYGVEVLKSLALWDGVKDKAVLAKDVRTIVTYVETGNVEAGIVFSTVAATSSTVTIAAAAPPGTHEAIEFPAVILAGTKKQKAAEEFLAYLTGPEAMKIFDKYGFRPAGGK